MPQKKLRKKLALAFVTTGVCLFVGEFALQLSGVRAERDERAVAYCRKIGRPYDQRTQLQVVRDLRLQGKDAWPVTFARCFYVRGVDSIVEGKSVIPLASISNVCTVTHNELGEYLVFDSDEYGFHNPPNCHRPGEVDVALIGDSFVMGGFVPDDGSIAARLRERGYRALNLGLLGNGPLSDLAIYSEYAAPLRPKNVVWFFSEENDADDILQEAHSSLRRYLDDGFTSNLRGMTASLDKELKAFATAEELRLNRSQPSSIWTDISRLRNTRVALKNIWLKARPSDYESDWQLIANIIKTAERRVRSQGGRFLIGYLPCHSRYMGLGPRKVAKCRAFIANLATELHVPLIDMVAEFAKAGDPLDFFPFRLNGHYTEEAYRLVANAVAENLTSKPTPPGH